MTCARRPDGRLRANKKLKFTGRGFKPNCARRDGGLAGPRPLLPRFPGNENGRVERRDAAAKRVVGEVGRDGGLRADDGRTACGPPGAHPPRAQGMRPRGGEHLRQPDAVRAEGGPGALPAAAGAGPGAVPRGRRGPGLRPARSLRAGPLDVGGGGRAVAGPRRRLPPGPLPAAWQPWC